MADKERNALIPLPAGGLENIGSGPKSVLSRMVSDALALARVRGKSLIEKRFRIGDYEFCDPDYRQILIWAKALWIEPEEVIKAFESSFYKISPPITLKVEDGTIVNLVWNFDLLSISDFEWVEGLEIKMLSFMGMSTAQLALRMPSLDELHCSHIGLTELDLSMVPALTLLCCGDNQLVELDLSMVPALTLLSCYNNQLVELDLSVLPALTELWCENNQLVELDLSVLPALTLLWCKNNQLAELDIRGLERLENFDCDPSVILKKLPIQNF